MLDVEFFDGGLNVFEEASAVLDVAFGGFEVGDVCGEVLVEGLHDHFAEIFCGHGGNGGGEVSFFGFGFEADGHPSFVFDFVVDDGVSADVFGLCVEFDLCAFEDEFELCVVV